MGMTYSGRRKPESWGGGSTSALRRSVREGRGARSVARAACVPSGGSCCHHLLVHEGAGARGRTRALVGDCKAPVPGAGGEGEL